MDANAMGWLAVLAIASLVPVVVRYWRKAPQRALMEVPEKPIASGIA